MQTVPSRFRRIVARVRAVGVVVAVAAPVLAVVTVSGGSPAAATTAADPCDALAWEGEQSGDQKIFVAAADGTDRFDVTVGSVGFPPTANERHTWSPDGSRVAWSGVIGPERYVVSASAKDGSGQVLVSAAEPGPDPSGNVDPAYAPDGDRIAWVGDDGGNDEVFVADADGTNRSEISSVGLGPDPTSNDSPAWSPDGTRIAWVGYLGMEQHVFIADPDGTDRTILSTGVGPTTSNKREPVWSPDGTAIMWWGSGRVIVAPVDLSPRLDISTVGPGPHPLVVNGPRWSPDGRRVIWAAGPGAEQIYVVDADGTDRTVVSTVGPGPDPVGNATPSWSPDGSRIAWVAGADGEQIWVADADGTNRVEIASVGAGVDPDFNWKPRWRPRGGDVDVAVSAQEPLTVGSIGRVTVSVSSTCRLSHVRVLHVVPPCLADAEVAVSAGALTGPSEWEVDLVHGSEQAVVTGVVTGPGDCSYTVDVNPATVPALTAPAAATASLAAVDPECVPPPSPFVDVPPSSFAYADVACIHGLGITTGTTPTTYDPAGFVTREQMAAFLGRSWLALGGPCPAGPAPFVDVAAGSFAAAHVDCIFALGITTGTSPTTYDPGGTVTREQMAAFLGRFWRAAVAAGLHT